MKKIFTILLVTLAAAGLFAQGAIELASDERPVKVISTTLTDNGTYDLNVIDQKGEVYIYHTNDTTESLFPIEFFKEGDILAIKDTGIMTMSIPAQLSAKEIRYITYMADSYGLSFAEVATTPEVASSVENAMWDVTIADDMISRFNYAYGYLTLENFKSQGLNLVGAYFAKGIIDFYENAEPLISIDQMDPIVEQYITDIFSAGVTHDVGPSYGSIDLIRGLALTDALEDKFSYSYGYMIAASLMYNGLDILAQPFIEGALTSIYSLEAVMTAEEMDSAIMEYSEYLNAQYEEYFKALQTENLAEAEAFLADNKTKEGVITLDSGLQYEIITAGDGAKPTAEDTVIVNYTLRMLDGTIMDQGTEVEFPLTSLIPGFVEVTTQMQVGEAVTAYIPPALGYGENGSNNIEPNSLLIFDIELLEIVQ